MTEQDLILKYGEYVKGMFTTRYGFCIFSYVEIINVKGEKNRKEVMNVLRILEDHGIIYCNKEYTVMKFGDRLQWRMTDYGKELFGFFMI